MQEIQNLASAWVTVLPSSSTPPSTLPRLSMEDQDKNNFGCGQWIYTAHSSSRHFLPFRAVLPHICPLFCLFSLLSLFFYLLFCLFSHLLFSRLLPPLIPLLLPPPFSSAFSSLPPSSAGASASSSSTSPSPSSSSSSSLSFFCLALTAVLLCGCRLMTVANYAMRLEREVWGALDGPWGSDTWMGWRRDWAQKASSSFRV